MQESFFNLAHQHRTNSFAAELVTCLSTVMQLAAKDMRSEGAVFSERLESEDLALVVEHPL